MPYLIDTDWVIDHLDDSPEAVKLLAELAAEGIAISVITYMEAFQGIVRSAETTMRTFPHSSYTLVASVGL